MSYFVAGLTNEDPETTAPVYKEYPVYVMYNDILAVSATGSVSFPLSADKYRYVIIQREFSQSTDLICIAEVKVFLRGTWTFCVALLVLQ